MSDLKKCYACETVYEDTIHICEPHKMSGGKEFPRLWLGPKARTLEYGYTMFAHKESPAKDFEAWIPEKEHTALLQEKDKEIGRLSRALLYNTSHFAYETVKEMPIEKVREALAGGKDES